MAHNKDRSRISVGEVDWDDPRLKNLLEKTEGLTFDQRSRLPGTEVRIRVVGGWDAGPAEKPALLVGEMDGVLMLVTHFPLPHGGEVQLSGLPASAQPRWATVSDEREGMRAEDKGQVLFLNRLRLR